MTRSALGWSVEVDGTGGYTHTARAFEGGDVAVSENPKANARPSIRIPVEKSEKWRAILTEDPDADLDMRVWKDGIRQPIDTLVNVEDRPGTTVLVGKGGRELGTRIERSYDQKAAHVAVSDIGSSELSYTMNVDTPPTTTQTNEALDSWSTPAEHRSRLEPQLLPTDPVEVGASGPGTLQTGFFAEAEDFDGRSGTRGTTGSEDDNYSGASGRVLEDTGDRLEWEFTPGYPIEGENVGIQVRVGLESGTQSAPAFTWYLDGEVVEFLGSPGAGIAVLGWDDIGSGSIYDGEGYQGGDLAADETHTLAVEVDDGGASGDRYYVDCVHVYDTRYSYTFDNSTDANDALEGPQTHPESHRFSYRIVPAPEAVTGARAELTVNEGSSPSGNFAIYLSNDQGANFTSNANSDTFETDALGATWGPGVILEVELSRYADGRTTTPTTGNAGHVVEAVTLEADLEDMPIIVNQTVDGHIDAVFRKFANLSDSLWSVDYDSGFTVEWTSPGQRTTTQDPGIVDYRTTTDTESVYQKAAVYGQSDVNVQGEQFAADHGTAVPLANDRIQPGSERVVGPETGERFRRQVDYTLDPQAGEITTLAGGGLTDGDVYEIDYRFQAFGEFTKSGVSSPKETEPVEIPGLTSDFLCRQAARIIIDEVDEPLRSAEVVIPNDAVGWSVVESFDPPIVPTDGNALHVRSVENTLQQTVLSLGSRRSLSDVVQDIRAQVSAVSRKA